jgi:hypothetical protein
MRAVSSPDRIFRSRHRTSVFSVHPTDPPLFLWSLAGEVGRAVLSRTKPVDCVLLGVNGAWWFITLLGWPIPRRAPYTLVLGKVFEITKGTRVPTHSPNAIHYCCCQSRRDRPLSVCPCALTCASASSSLRQCNQHRRFGDDPRHLLSLPRFWLLVRLFKDPPSNY